MTDGYHAVSMRSVATEAGVDPALVSYFFGSKQGLAGAALTLAANPSDILATLLPGDLDGLAARVLRGLLATWDDRDTGRPLHAMVRMAAQDPTVARLVREMVEEGIVNQVAARLTGSDALQRAGVFATALTGVIFTRYLMGVNPIATMPADELVRRMAPALRLSLRPQPPGPRPGRQPLPVPRRQI